MFCSVLSMQILPVKAQQNCCVSCLVSEWIHILNESGESMIQKPIHKVIHLVRHISEAASYGGCICMLHASSRMSYLRKVTVIKWINNVHTATYILLCNLTVAYLKWVSPDHVCSLQMWPLEDAASEMGHIYLLNSWTNQPFEWIQWINDSKTFTATCWQL